MYHTMEQVLTLKIIFTQFPTERNSASRNQNCINQNLHTLHLLYKHCILHNLLVSSNYRSCLYKNKLGSMKN